MSEVLLINQVLQDSNLFLLEEGDNETLYQFKHNERSIARVYLVELRHFLLRGFTRTFIFIIREDKLVYFTMALKAQHIESLIDSYLNDEGLLRWKFPYGSIGLENQLTRWFKIKNNILTTTRPWLVHHSIKKYNKWLQISGSFGE